MLSADLAVIFPKYKPQNERNRTVDTISQVPHSTTIILVSAQVHLLSFIVWYIYVRKQRYKIIGNQYNTSHLFYEKNRLFIVIQQRYIARL